MDGNINMKNQDDALADAHSYDAFKDCVMLDAFSLFEKLDEEFLSSFGPEHVIKHQEQKSNQMTKINMFNEYNDDILED